MVHTAPLIHITVAEAESVDCHDETGYLSRLQFQASDMLHGDLESGLGGARRYLDIPPVNYHHGNQ